jgi:glucose/arabinose dehydrogenase
MRRSAAVACILAILVGACGGGSDSATPTTTAAGTATTASSTSGGAPSAPLPRVALASLAAVSAGTAIATRAGDSAIYLTEQSGVVRALRGGRLDPTPVLDLTDQVLTGSERGLLGLLFSADGATLYAYWTARQPTGQVTIGSFPMGPTTANKSGKKVLVTVDHATYGNHNGGILQLGLDGFLYAGIGDGGSSGDPDDNGLNTSTLLGKVIRIDPTKPGDGRPYGIPPGNPFAAGGGRPEIWAYGLRNPWRLSFDAPTSTLWIADVGQDKYEEVNRVPAATAGASYGWSKREGLHAFEGGEKPAGAVEPIAELAHNKGFCSITGGYVYRGAALPGLTGRYVFGDYCDRALRVVSETAAGWVVDALSVSAANVRTFGVDQAGELVLLDDEGLKRLVAG